MPTPANALDITSAGIVVFDGTATFTADTTTNHNVLVGATSNGITNVAPSSTSGIPLVSNGSSADPSFTTAVVAGGGTGVTSFTAYSVICGGTTTTGALQNVSGVGSSGQVLTSNGASALPTWQTLPIYTYVGVSNNYSVLATDTIVGVTSTASTYTMTLPNTGLFTGKYWVIKDESGGCSTNNITISGNGANIDGSSTYVMKANYESVTIYYNGSNFFVI